MKKQLQKLVLVTMALFGLLAVPALVAVPSVAADAADEICNGVIATGAAGCDDTAQGEVDRIVKLVIQIFSFVVGIASVIMIIVGGFKYIISSGDSGNINSAKNTILYAIIGLVVVALAQVIVRFVLNKV